MWLTSEEELFMGWTYKQRKHRDALRRKYTEETGQIDYTAPAFREWLIERGELE